MVYAWEDQSHKNVCNDHKNLIFGFGKQYLFKVEKETVCVMLKRFAVHLKLMTLAFCLYCYV